MNNIYQTAREACGITQERAAELIGLSVESIRSYETEKRIPSDDTVIKMVDIYNANYLAYQHLKYKTQVGNIILPEVDQTTISEAVLKWMHEMHDCMELKLPWTARSTKTRKTCGVTRWQNAESCAERFLLCSL